MERVIVRAKKPPCVYCDERRPHGGGIISTMILFHNPLLQPLNVEIEMPFCNYPSGRTPEEIVASIIDANPEINTIIDAIRMRIIDYLKMGYHHFAYC